MDRPSNINFGKTQITDKIRVSTAAIYSAAHFGEYWQVETWCFSDDPRQRSFQVIHGTSGILDGEFHDHRLRLIAEKVHKQIACNLIRKYTVIGEN